MDTVERVALDIGELLRPGHNDAVVQRTAEIAVGDAARRCRSEADAADIAGGVLTACHGAAEAIERDVVDFVFCLVNSKPVHVTRRRGEELARGVAPDDPDGRELRLG